MALPHRWYKYITIEGLEDESRIINPGHTFFLLWLLYFIIQQIYLWNVREILYKSVSILTSN